MSYWHNTYAYTYNGDFYCSGCRWNNWADIPEENDEDLSPVSLYELHNYAGEVSREYRDSQGEIVRAQVQCGGCYGLIVDEPPYPGGEEEDGE